MNENPQTVAEAARLAGQRMRKLERKRRSLVRVSCGGMRLAATASEMAANRCFLQSPME